MKRNSDSGNDVCQHGSVCTDPRSEKEGTVIVQLYLPFSSRRISLLIFLHTPALSLSFTFSRWSRAFSRFIFSCLFISLCPPVHDAVCLQKQRMPRSAVSLKNKKRPGYLSLNNRAHPISSLTQQLRLPALR